jgi:hypothetical protein
MINPTRSPDGAKRNPGYGGGGGSGCTGALQKSAPGNCIFRHVILPRSPRNRRHFVGEYRLFESGPQAGSPVFSQE